MVSPNILALDFDGVVCDGLREYFQTAWRAYTDVFDPSAGAAPKGLAERFYLLRPVVETGWEMPLVLYGLMNGVADEEILDRWSELVPQLLEQGKVEPATLGQAVDGVRDRWIAQDLEGWLSYQSFYPGVIDRLRQAVADGIELVIISTKEGRFIQQLLAQAGLELPSEGSLGSFSGDSEADTRSKAVPERFANRIMGKEVKQPKYETLRQIQAACPRQTIWFVEDRVKALQAVQRQSDLDTVDLFLADWGYNTAADRDMATDGIYRLTLPQFCSSFPDWMA